MDAIDDLLQLVRSLPPAPKLLPELLTALADVDCDIGRVVNLITFDPALTARVLQVCNSATFMMSVRVNNVADAVNRMGFHGVYTIVALASSEEFLRKDKSTAIDPDVMWRHLVTAAFAAQFVAKKVGADGNMLFTAALLHDLGKVALAEVLAGDYDALVTDPKLFGRPLAALESASFGMNHAEVGARLMESWSFAPDFAATLRFHHDCAAGGDVALEAACVELADLLAHSLDAADDEDPFAEMETAPALATAGLTMPDLLAQREKLKGKLEIIDAMCGPAR